MSSKEALNHDNINVHPGTVNYRSSPKTDIRSVSLSDQYQKQTSLSLQNLNAGQNMSHPVNKASVDAQLVAMHENHKINKCLK